MQLVYSGIAFFSINSNNIFNSKYYYVPYRSTIAMVIDHSQVLQVDKTTAIDHRVARYRYGYGRLKAHIGQCLGTRIHLQAARPCDVLDHDEDNFCTNQNRSDKFVAGRQFRNQLRNCYKRV